MSDRYRILYFHQDGLITGSLISLKNLLVSLDKKTFEPLVILPKDGPARQVLEAEGVSVRIFPFRTFWTTPGPRCISRDNLAQQFALIPNMKLRALISELKPHAIHLNDKATMNVGISCMGLKIPVIQHSRSAFHITACAFNKQISQVLIRKYAKHIICISEDEEQGFENLPNKSIIFNAVNRALSDEAMMRREQTRAELGIRPGEFVIGVAENLGVYKGVYEVIGLAEKLLKKHHQVTAKFMLVGNISDQDNLSRYGVNLSSKEFVNDFISRNNYSDRFILTGFQKDALRYIAAMDTIMIAKAHGVLGRQPLEAQSVGTPVVAINGHSRRSTIVKHGETGFLVNTPDALAGAIEQLIDNPDLKTNMGRSGLTYARLHFDPQINAQKIERIYRQYISQN